MKQNNTSINPELIVDNTCIHDTITQLPPLGEELQAIVDDRDVDNISVFGLHNGQRVLLANELAKTSTVLYVCDDYYRANEVYEQLHYINDSVVNLPQVDDVLSIRTYNNTNSQQRLHALQHIVQGISIIVTTTASCLQPCVERQLFEKMILTLDKGREYSIDTLNKTWIDNNYSRVESVSEPGQFCWRGDIVDIWGAGESVPIRLDFFGDELENIKTFDPESRLSTGQILQVRLAPNIESNSTSCLRDFVGDCVLIVDDAREVADARDRVLQEHNNRLASLLSTDQIGANLPIKLLQDGLDIGRRKVACHKDLSQNRLFVPHKTIDIRTFGIQDYSRDFVHFVLDIELWLKSGYTVVLCVGSAEQATILHKLIAQHKLYGVDVLIGGVLRGAVLGKCILIGQRELFRRISSGVRKNTKQLFGQIAPGDYVVHHIHGIGLYERADKLDISGTPRDYLVIKYKNDDTLYVPVENMDSISKFSSHTLPVLNKIGGQEFDKVKNKVKQSVRKMALGLAQLYASREQAKGDKYDIDTSAFAEFENAFVHTPTDCQVRATQDILQDLNTGKVMDRLICGDVGYGKTEVAMRAAYCLVLQGKQVAFVCPTTILAKQHANTLRQRMSRFGVNIAEFSRFESAKQIDSNISDLANGTVDIAVGTHRLLQKDIVFKDLGLLVLDEEQRFGVADKEKIKRLKVNINVLTLSATPIPRTLHMSLQNIRDISILDTPPKARIPIQTYVAEYTDNLLRDAVMRELGRGGAAFVVYNKVADIDRFVSRLQALLPKASFVIAHGQQSADMMEDSVNKFVNGDANVLVASTLIENGVDMPHANTMIVIDADKLGLAQMYQLRGRVGRSDRQAYAYFTYDRDKTITPQAFKRLDAITEFTEFGSGFKLAMRDLEIRGAGNILGREQHGHMEKVGYDMYCQLLSDTVTELKSGLVVKRRDVKVITDLPSYIPDDYIPDKQSKLDVYGRVSTIMSLQDREILHSELTNIYGNPPVSVANLLTIGLLKNLSQTVGAASITLRKHKYSVQFDKVNDIAPSLYKIVQPIQIVNIQSTPTIQFKDAKDMLITLRRANANASVLVDSSKVV
jgi:transcription-repair coupling factor (superfamily II helicase)